MIVQKVWTRSRMEGLVLHGVAAPHGFAAVCVGDCSRRFEIDRLWNDGVTERDLQCGKHTGKQTAERARQNGRQEWQG